MDELEQQFNLLRLSAAIADGERYLALATQALTKMTVALADGREALTALQADQRQGQAGIVQLRKA